MSPPNSENDPIHKGLHDLGRQIEEAESTTPEGGVPASQPASADPTPVPAPASAAPTPTPAPGPAEPAGPAEEPGVTPAPPSGRPSLGGPQDASGGLRPEPMDATLAA